MITHPIVRGFRLTPEDTTALDALVEAEERNRSDVMRRLIRDAARARGLLPEPTPITAATLLAHPIQACYNNAVCL